MNIHVHVVYVYTCTCIYIPFSSNGLFDKSRWLSTDLLLFFHATQNWKRISLKVTERKIINCEGNEISEQWMIGQLHGDKGLTVSQNSYQE